MSDYTVQADIQLVRTTQGAWNAFGILVRATDVDDGYTFSICQPYSCTTENYIAMLGNAQQGTMSAANMSSVNYQPDSGYHTYRIEVKGNAITGFIDGSQILQATDNTYLGGGQIGLWCAECQISVRSVEVYAA